MNKIFYFLMVFFAFSAVQVGAQDGKGAVDAPGFKVGGANMGDAICPEGGCDVARGTEKSRDMKGDLDNLGSPMPHTLMRPMDGTGAAPMGAPGMGAPGMGAPGMAAPTHCAAGQVMTPGVGCRDM